MNKIRIAIVLVVLFILGVAMTVSGVSDLIKLNGNVPDFNYESMQDIKKGDFVQGYVWNIDGCYANTTTTETTFGIETDSYVSDEYFLMPLVNDTDLEDEMYITIVASKRDDRNLLYEINEATWEYYEGNFDVTFPDMGIVAKVSKLGSEYEGFLVEAMLSAEYYSTASEARSHIIPYKLTIYNTKSAYTSLGIGLLIIAVFAVVGIIFYNKFKKSNEPESFIPATQTESESTAAENGFAESYTPPQPVPIPNIPQPTDAEEFFARTPKAEAPVEEAPAEEAAPAEQPAEVTLGNMDGLDTTGLLNDSDYDYGDPDNEFIE